MNNIEIFNKTNHEIEDIESVKKVIDKTLEVEDTHDVEFNVIFVTDAYIWSLNKDYRGIDSITDVISFALEDTKDIDVIPRMLGDIYICFDKALEQAKEYGHSIKREICFLTVHGLLHLLGYSHDNEDNEKIMIDKQEMILNETNIQK